MNSFLESILPSPQLTEGELHIWTLPAQSYPPSEYEAILAATELDRASRLRFRHLSDSFTADHLRLRLLLGHYTHTDPAEIRYDENAYGKPSLAHPGSDLMFNLTHSGGIALVAICRSHPVGIDVESVRPIPDWIEIARSHFSAREHQQLLSAVHPEPRETGLPIPSQDPIALFLRCWTRKESFIKAIGTGLSLPLDSFTVSFLPQEPPALVEWAASPQQVREWSLFHLDPAPGFIGACAVHGRGWSLRHFTWTAH